MKKSVLILFIIISSPVSGYEKNWEVCFTDPEKIRKNSYNSEKMLIRAINLCNSSFNGAFYDISSVRVEEALIKAYKRGVSVKIVTDSDNFSGKSIEHIIDSGIPVVDDRNQGLMHNKFAIIDDSIVYTGSTNATDNGVFRNNNNSILIRSPELAEIYNSEFDEMFMHGVFGNKYEAGALTPFLKKYYVKVDEININAYFAPEDNVERIINKRLKKAKKTIRFMAFSFTSDCIGETMIEKFKEGVSIEGVFESRGSQSEYSEYTKMMIEGLPVVKDHNRYIMHHKVIIIDDSIVITGSFNFSKNANSRNDENILILESNEIAAKYTEEFRRVYKAGVKK